MAELGRFIPACAGNSLRGMLEGSVGPVHPRVCGEQKNGPRQHIAGNGSSPRVRGTAYAACWKAALGRFIPACAGNRRTGLDNTSPGTVHPRVCGEQHPQGRRFGECYGSSPRVRGTGLQPILDTSRIRFIPACAGNSQGLNLRGTGGPVHPRVCGEQNGQTPASAGVFGSSPRVRGTDSSHA